MLAQKHNEAGDGQRGECEVSAKIPGMIHVGERIVPRFMERSKAERLEHTEHLQRAAPRKGGQRLPQTANEHLGYTRAINSKGCKKTQLREIPCAHR
jgi:hypothetical protein